MTPPRARRIASRALWAELHGYEGHHLTERQRLGAWRRAMRGMVRCPSNARQIRTPAHDAPQQEREHGQDHDRDARHRPEPHVCPTCHQPVRTR